MKVIHSKYVLCNHYIENQLIKNYQQSNMIILSLQIYTNQYLMVKTKCLRYENTVCLTFLKS